MPAEVFNDNATHMTAFNGKNIDVVPGLNGASLQVEGTHISMSQRDYDKFLAMDDFHKRRFVERFVYDHAQGLAQKLSGESIPDRLLRSKIGTPYNADGEAVIRMAHPQAQDFLAIKAALLFDQMENPSQGQEYARSTGLGR